MTGIWSLSRSGWHPEKSVTFAQEAELHNLVEQTPEVLPLAGAPRLVVLGREVRCGREYADLIAIEVATGRPTVIEIKLASNTDRRHVLTQVLGYAAYLRRLDTSGFEALLASHVAKLGTASVAAAVEVGSQESGFDRASFTERMKSALEAGLIRCVVVIDAAPPDLVDLVGYIQEVTNDRLSLDLVTVAAYDIGGRRVLVPQLVEPDRSQVTPVTSTHGTHQSTTVIEGSDAFAESIGSAEPQHRQLLTDLLNWARGLEAKNLVVLYTSIGKDRWVLNLRLPGQLRSLVVIWNDKGGYLSPFRSVFEKQAPKALAMLDQNAPGEIKQGNYIKLAYDAQLLGLLQDAYQEAWH